MSDSLTNNKPDENINASIFFQKLGFKVSLVDEELWLPLQRFDEVKQNIEALISDTVAKAEREARIEAAEHIKEICPVTEGASVERLHNRIDTYLSQLKPQQESEDI